MTQCYQTKSRMSIICSSSPARAQQDVLGARHRRARLTGVPELSGETPGALRSFRAAVPAETTPGRDYRLWPLPPPKKLRAALEWPLLGIARTATHVDADGIVAKAARAPPVVPPQ